MFDKRKELPYRTSNSMQESAVENLQAGWATGNTTQILSGFDEFLKAFGDPGETIPDVLRSTYSAVDFFDWLYSVDHIRLAYGISYDGTPLENLSPGTKGIVLQILYLAMDQHDTRPLLIDQPDENLDNESIYNLLASYFRRSKRRRQILLITHNPNLVVNTDSEQVVVAYCTKGETGLPVITYNSGSLENATPPDGIRQSVCRILEGGERAFRERERRYALQ